MNKLIATLVLFLTQTAFAEPADSTLLGKTDVTPATQQTLLASGTLTSTGEVSSIATTKRCAEGTAPQLTSSLVETYRNAFYAISGIVNQLHLSSDYRITGQLFMTNKAGPNSSATANWQIWCQPVQSA